MAQLPDHSPKIYARPQKHPATFQCSLCPSRFTRAFNLRNHLRIHTHERPFVCSVCGKSFSRSHDRKTHEELHSGKRKFCCKGFLKNGSIWGCGRYFSRSSNLGRHFRSEIGRICIKPLIDEEVAEHNDAATLTNIARMDHAPNSEAPLPLNVSNSVTAARIRTASPSTYGHNAGAPVVNDWSSWERLWSEVPSPESRSNTQATKSSDTLSPHEKVQLLEKILRDKGFDVEVELSSATRVANQSTQHN